MVGKKIEKVWLSFKRCRSNIKHISEMLESKEREAPEVPIQGHWHLQPSVYPLCNCHRFKDSNWSKGIWRRHFFFLQEVLTNLVFFSQKNDRGNLCPISQILPTNLICAVGVPLSTDGWPNHDDDVLLIKGFLSFSVLY